MEIKIIRAGESIEFQPGGFIELKPGDDFGIFIEYENGLFFKGFKDLQEFIDKLKDED